MQPKTCNPQLVAKIIFIGDSGVGKTSILNQKVRNIFKFATQSTNNPEQSSLKINAEGVDVNLKLWDTAGQEKFRSITISFYKESKGAFIIFDLTNKQTFENVRLWVRQLKNHAGENIVKILLGNKSDLLPLAVEQVELENLANEIGASFYFVSAYQNKNVEEAFEDMALQIKKKFYVPDQNQQEATKLKQSLVTTNQDKSGCC